MRFQHQEDIDFYGNFDPYRILLSQFIAFTVLQVGRLLIKHLSVAILWNGPGLWNIILKAIGTLQSLRLFQEK